MIKLLTLIIALSIGFYTRSGYRDIHTSNTPEIPEISFYGVKILVNDLDEGMNFYSAKLGFKILSSDDNKNEIIFKTNTFPLKLGLSTKKNTTDFFTESHAKIAFQVNHMLSTFQSLKNKGIDFFEDELSKNGIGIGLPFLDPFGNRHTLVEVQITDQQIFLEPIIYNTGFNVPDIEKAETFYTKLLGFEVYSRNYLPAALPLKNKDGSFAFMLHHRKESAPASIHYPENSQTLLIFKTDNLENTITYLKEHGIKLLLEQPKIDDQIAYTAFADPFNNAIEIMEIQR